MVGGGGEKRSRRRGEGLRGGGKWIKGRRGRRGWGEGRRGGRRRGVDERRRGGGSERERGVVFSRGEI